MLSKFIPVWKKAPFIRFLVPLVTGIVLQWQLQLPVKGSWYVLGFSFLLSLFSFGLPYFTRYRLLVLHGIATFFIFLSLGALLTWYKDIRHHSDWFGNFYRTNNSILVTLKEQPSEKTNSFKALAQVENIDSAKTKGDIIIYFEKDSSVQSLDYGSQVAFTKPLQEIKNAGNPGGFDYKRYCIFQSITHQVYLKQGDFIVLNKKKTSFFNSLLFSIRKKVIQILRSNIPGEKEQGLAEALLIGYKDDLDKNLVQSYTNTGVVHIIAISGMHIALIYWVLAFLCKPFKKFRHSKWMTTTIILTGLWLFSFVAGGEASVLRSAVMFTCIVIGENFTKKTSIFNTLAFSAFGLLCYNPFWLWDVGFQLSYAAVLSIVIFMRPIYNWFYIKNKALDFIWKLNAVSIAAQLLTTPLSIYHFHQFPNFFLLTNFIAVPLSSIIVLGEIALCAVSFIPLLSIWTGKILSWLIWLMNSYIEKIEALPHSLWDGLQITIWQAVLLIIMVAGFGYWFLEKRKTGTWVGVLGLLLFILFRTFSFYNAQHQRKIIVYNVPKHRALDFIEGRSYHFIGDSDLLTDDFARNFHLKPSRILHRLDTAGSLDDLLINENLIQFAGKKILLIDTSLHFEIPSVKIPVDLLVVSKNPKLYFTNLQKSFDIGQVVFDGSVPLWKLKYWKKDCDSLHILHYDVNEKGAFVMNLN